MAIGNDLNQRLVLILQKKGDENIDQIKAKLNELKGEFQAAGEALVTAFERGEGNLLEFNRATADLQTHYKQIVKLLEDVAKQNNEVAMEEGKAQRERIEGWAKAYDEIDRYQAKLKAMHTADMNAAADKVQADRDATAAAQKQAAAQAKIDSDAAAETWRRRAELYARLERMGQDLLEAERKEAKESLQAQKDAAGEAILAKANLYARLERMAEEEIEAEKMRKGKEKLDRIMAYADTEMRAEQANEAAKKQIGDAIRAAAEKHARIDEYEEDQHKKNMARMTAEFKAAESLRNQKMLYERLAKGTLNDNQIKELERLTTTIQGVNKFSDESIEKFNLVGGGMDRLQQRSKNLALGLMAVAHASQDAQYGFGAVLNNIPQITYAFASAVPAIEKYSMQISAIAMIGGTLVNVALPHIKQFATTFATELGFISDPLRTAAITTDQLKTKIEALQSKSWKVDLDYRLIADAQKQMSDLESRLKAWDAIANNRTSIEQESGKRFGETISENANPQAFKDALMDALGKMGRLRLGTKEEADLKGLQDELKDIMTRIQDPKTDQEERAIQMDRRLHVESLLAPMREAVRKQVQAKLDGILGGAAQGRNADLQDIQAAFAFSPDSFQGKGMNLNKIAAGLMGAGHDIIRDERESAREAAKQEAQAKREKRLRDDQTDELNNQAKEHDAAVKPLIDGAKQRKDAVIRQWVRDNEEDADRIERHVKQAPAVAARAQRALTAAERRRQADMNRFNRELDAENKERAIGEYAKEFQDFGFAPGLAAKAGEMMQQKAKAHIPEQLAYAQVLDAVARLAKKQEEAIGISGQATMLVARLDAEIQMMNMQMQRQRQALGRVGNKRRTLLNPPGQAN